jgi:hypothetical protein
VFDVVVQPVRMLVTEQDVVVMEEEDCGSTTVVPVLKIEGFANAGSSLPHFPRAGFLRDVNTAITGQALRVHQIQITHSKYEAHIREASRR